jgi:thymidine phosphorylase
MALCAEMLVLGKLAADEVEARQKLQAALDTGAATERFARMVVALGGPANLVENPDRHLEQAPIVVPAPALKSGYAAATDCRGIGLSVVSLGGGRRRPTDAIDFAVGLTELAGLGDRIEAGQPLAMVHARTEAAAAQAIAEIQAAYTIAEDKPAANPVIYRTIRP